MGRTLSLWTVGVSSFDAELDYSNGHVVHIAEPRFLARWTMKESHFTTMPTLPERATMMRTLGYSYTR
jgi:hypothetical protein